MRALKGLIVIVCIFIAAPLFAFYPQWISKSHVSSPSFNSIATGDFNEDGRPDVIGRTSSTMTLYTTNSDGTLASGVTVQSGGYLGGPVVADVNGDGHLDVVVGDNSAPPEGPADKTSIIVRPGNGDGTFGSTITTTLSFSPTNIRAGDFNEDGKTDLAIRSYASAIEAVYTGDGTGHFSEAVRLPIGEVAADHAVGDIDHDGHTDIALGYWDGKPYRIYFGHGDATFDAPVDYVSPTPSTTRMILADLDHDHDLELLFTDSAAKTLTIVVNLGSRTFAAPAPYTTYNSNTTYGDASDLAAGDIDQDGNVDIVVVLVNSHALATFLGNGNGTVRSFVYSGSFPAYYPRAVALADVTGDSRPDLFLGSAAFMNVFENRAGDIAFNIRAVTPTITVGQTARISVQVCRVGPYLCSDSVLTHETITLRSNGAAVGSGVLDQGIAVIDVTSPLPLGTHSITAEFPGNDDFHAGVSDAVTQRVIAERTTTTVQSSAAGRDVEYGESWSLTTTVTSPLPDPLNGPVWLFTNDIRSQYARSGPTANWYSPEASAGAYHFYATFDGTAMQPPSTSEVITQVVRKGRPTVSIPYGLNVGRYGSLSQLYVEAHTSFTTFGMTHVKLVEGSTLVGETGTRSSEWINVSLPVGVHYLEAVFEGNENFEPARSQPFRFTVLPAGFVIDAFATGNTVRIAAFPTLSYSYMKLSRRVGNGPWEPSTYMSDNPRTETNLAPGVYSYRAELYDLSNQQQPLVATSNIDVAIVGANFSDDPLVSGQPIRAAHISELVAATNTMLAAAGLQPLTISDAGAGQPIRASHMNALRDAINSARTALGMMSPQWTDTSPPGGFMRATQIMEMRDALR